MFPVAARGPIEYLEAPLPARFDFFTHAFCTRRGGVSEGPFSSLNVSDREGDDPDRVRRNFAAIAAAFGFQTGQFHLVNQVHRDGIWIVDRPAPRPENAAPPPFDALVTGRPGAALCIQTADCVPILLADPVRRVVGAVHAGWKGTALGIAEKTVHAFVRSFASRPQDLFAFIGPAIGSCCYEVDAPVFAAMAGHPRQSAFLRPVRGKERWMLDLPMANRIQLTGGGIPPERILSAGLCTSCRPDLFFSHRREAGRTGRQLNFILLRGPSMTPASQSLRDR